MLLDWKLSQVNNVYQILREQILSILLKRFSILKIVSLSQCKAENRLLQER